MIATTNDHTKRAVIYLRVASSYPGDTRAVELQRHACERIAAKHGLIIVREYRDIGRPARLIRQFGLQRLLHDLATRRDAAHVIVWGYPVLARDMGQLDDIVGELARYRAEVLTITGVETVKRDSSIRVMDAVLDDTPTGRAIQPILDPTEEE